ncbi:MAG: 5-formyltetrahydrofolate cyclo-ligase [Cocleimonas sp.]
MSNCYPNKDTLRKQIRSKRADLSQLNLQQKSAKIISQVSQSLPFKNAQKIAFYYAVQGEADPGKLTLENTNEDKVFYLPVLSQIKEQGLLFAPTHPASKYKNNKFSIPEPICNSTDLVTGNALDLVIMPLLGFDKQGNRLGMGGGFYDRTFSFKQSKESKPILMGFAFDFQEVDKLKAEEWDIPMDFIATESVLFSI